MIGGIIRESAVRQPRSLNNLSRRQVVRGAVAHQPSDRPGSGRSGWLTFRTCRSGAQFP